MSRAYERRLIIIGKTGTGKSSLGNVLLGRREFKEGRGFNAVTKESTLAKTEGRLSMVDTTGLFDTDRKRSLFMQALEIQRAIKVCPNPHAFLIVLNGSSRLTEEELLTIDMLCIIFGEQCLKNAIIVLTHVENDVSEAELATMLEKSKEFRNLINRCGNGFARIDNKDPRPEYIQRIFKLVDEVSREGKDSYKNEYIHVNKRVISQETAIENQDSGPVHLQIKRISIKIMKAVEEEKEFRNKFVKVAGACIGTGVIVVAGVGLLYLGGGATLPSVEKSVNIATGLISGVSSAR